MKNMRLLFLLGIMCISHFANARMNSGAAPTDSPSHDFLAGTIYERIAKEEHIDPTLLYALALVESGRGVGTSSVVAPWPYVLRAQSTRYFAHSASEYRAACKLFEQKYGDHFDVGPMQLNAHWQVTVGKKVSSISYLLDLKTNLRIAAETLKAAMHSTSDPALGIGRYHTWSDPKAARLFGKRVLSVQQHLEELQAGL